MGALVGDGVAIDGAGVVDDVTTDGAGVSLLT